jgi:hypothetical protein
MTIRFTKSWNGYYEGQIVSNPAGGNTEAQLIALGYAVADLDGPDNSFELAKFATDSTGNVTGLVGPGGSTTYPISPIGIEFAQHIRRFSGKLSQAYNSQINIGVIGHSVVAGAYSNDTVANNDGAWNTSGWVAVMRSYFQGRFGTASPKGGLFPAELFSTNFTVAGGAALNGPNNSVGLGGNRVDLAAAANTCTVTGTGRYLRVWGFATTAGVAARYNTDGGGLNTAGTTSSGASPNGQFWYVFDIDCATDAAHSVVLQGAASGSWYMYGFAFYSQTSTGVVVHRMGWSGKVLPDLIASSLDATDTAGPAWRTTLTANAKEQQLQSITTQMGLHLAVIMVDVNDLTGGWTSYGYTLADVKRHAQNIATALAAKNIDVVFAVGLWRDPSSYGANVPFDQQQVIDAYREVASVTDRVALMDFTKAYPTYAEFNADGYMQDTVHPTSLGHAWMGRVLYNGLISL